MSTIKPIYYMQSDPQWKTKPYRVVGKENSTIGSAGCGPTSASMVLATFIDKGITPVTTANWSMANGFKAVNQGTYYTYFKAQFAKYNMVSKQLNSSSLYHNPNSSVHNVALNELKAGNWLICCMGPGNWTKAGHFILVYKYENGKVYINDPASKAANRVCNTWDKLKYEVKYYFAITIPKSHPTNAEDRLESKYSENCLKLQKAINKDMNAGLVEDGIYGAKTGAVVNKIILKAGSYDAKNKKYKKGTTGEIVKFVQEYLGFKGKDIDGIYGNGTRNKVVSYQGKHGLNSDGIVGPVTLRTMI